jgi:uncharacterized protein
VSDFASLPSRVAWRFTGVRSGWERTRFVVGASMIRALGVSRGVDADEGLPWRVAYDLRWDRAWRFRAATVQADGTVRRVNRDDERGWVIDGVAQPEFADCRDLDLQVSLLTNAAPAHRLADRRRIADAPAVYLTSTLGIERLDQTYRRLAGGTVRFDYDSPGYRGVLRFGRDGLVVDYPFLGRRA